MKRKLTDNFPLKIMSLIVGIFIWFLVVNVDNPIETQSFVVGVELLNEAYVDETGMVCMVDEEQELARVTITTDRRTLRDISTDDIQAMADLQQAVSLETDPVMVPITAVCKGVSANNIKIYPQNLSVHLEEKLTKEFAVNIVNSGSGPGKGYILVMKQGELVESGTHDALVKQGGEYAKMWSNYTKTTKWHIGNEVKVC